MKRMLGALAFSINALTVPAAAQTASEAAIAREEAAAPLVADFAQDILRGSCGSAARDAARNGPQDGRGTGVVIYGYSNQLRARIADFRSGEITPRRGDGMESCMRTIGTAPMVGYSEDDGATRRYFVDMWLVVPEGYGIPAPPQFERGEEAAERNATVFNIRPTAFIPTAQAALTQ